MRRYPAVRNSGVEWLGSVPAHWPVCPLGYRYQVALGKMLDAKRVTGNHLKPYLRNVDVQWDLINTEELPSMDFAPEEQERYRLRFGDLLVCEGGEVGRAAVWEDQITECYYQKALHRLRPRDQERDLPRFVYYVLAAATALELFTNSEGKSTIAHLTADTLRGYRFPFPPLPEQRAIAGFLDRETAKIDALVEEQRRLIALLKEKRQAVISHAVTKGLDPDAPMKPSGIDWLGDIPAHWEAVPVGYRYEVQLGRMLNAERAVGDHPRPYLRVFDVQWHRINVEDLPTMDFPPDAQERYRLEPGDLLVNEGGSYVGRSAIWRGEVEECYYQKALHRLRPLDRDRDYADFFVYVMEFATVKGVFVAGGNQTTIDHLTAEQLRRYRFAFPSPGEQLQISRYLQERLGQTDALIAEAERAITLLQERRSALISAAVTGKIDVRDTIQDSTEAA